MPSVALIALLIFGFFAFGVRSVVHYRRTGSTGFRGFSGRPGSLEWCGGALFAIALSASLLAPLLAYWGMIVAWSGLDHLAVHVLGLLLYAVGLAGTIWAQFAMRDSWRIGVDPSERTELVTNGPFQWIRNPIYSAMMFGIVGLALLTPNLVALCAVSALVVGLELHVRFVEEPYLLKTHGEAYRNYAARTGRFIPSLGCLATA